MRDPFRPNTDSQLVREAQFAFVVIVVLLCVLVYTAFHRVSGKKLHFRQISQTAPLALHVNDTSYPAQTLLDKESKFTQETIDNSKSIAKPNRAKRNRPASTTTILKAIEKQSKEKVVIASAAKRSTQSVAQAQFIAPAKSDTESQPRLQTKPTTNQPTGDDLFEKIKSKVSFSEPVKPLPRMANDKEQNQQSIKSKPVVSGDTRGNFHPPRIKSDFGAGSIRELPPFEAPFKKETSKEARNPTPTQLQPVLPKLQEDAFSIKRKTAATITKPFNKIKKPVATVTEKIPESKPQVPVKQRLLSPDEYRVQKTDSLWSIAVDHYGDGRFFRALHQHNFERLTAADRLEPDSLIAVPMIDELLNRYPQLCPADKLGVSSTNSDDNKSALTKTDYDMYEKSMDARFHITEAGDTLFDVARQRLGQASRYLEIFELNQFRIPRHVNHLTPLAPGLRLLLPE